MSRILDRGLAELRRLPRLRRWRAPGPDQQVAAAGSPDLQFDATVMRLCAMIIDGVVDRADGSRSGVAEGAEGNVLVTPLLGENV